jgi:iron complex transport system permease protein
VIVVCLVIAAAVSVSGLIGFVGLVVPHIVRRLVGGRHSIVIPTSAVLGALLLVWADAAARVAFAPRELPLGILTALIGTPLLIALIRRSATER